MKTQRMSLWVVLSYTAACLIPCGTMAIASSPTGFSLPGRNAGQNGVPQVVWGDSGINGRLLAGPAVEASVNGTGGGSSVFLGSGASYVNAADLYLPMNGISWHHTRTYSSLNPSALTWQGEEWWCNEMMNITVAGTEGASDVTCQMDPNYSLTFTYTGGAYNPASDNYPFTITFVGGSDEYQIRRTDGLLYVFHDAGATNAGKLKRIEDAYGNDWAFTYSSGKLTDIVVDVVDGSDHKITYTYFTSGDNNNKLQYVKAYKTTTTTDANLIGQAEYAYHSSASDDYGTTGDLMKVIISRKGTTDGDGVLSIGETYYYRYWKGTYNSSTNPGTDHQLRYVLFPENADRLGTPESQNNANFEAKANIVYEYDGNGRVRKTDERLPGSGCGCGGGSAGTTDYTWTVNGGTPNLDTYKVHCVADREDNTRVIFDMNRLYQVLTWVVQNEDDGSPTREMIWHFDYGTSGANENRLAQIHYPSACSAYDTGTYAVTLRSSAGLIYEMDYDYSTNTYDGYPERIRVKQGTSGTAETLKAYGRTITERPDLATSIIEYESTGEADGRTTSLTYTFYDGAKYQIKQIDTTYPSVSTGKNGPNSSAVEKQFFDARTGALRWSLDGEGYVNFHAYDSETGVENLTVIDANTSSLLAAIDTAWDGVAHGGLAADDTVPFARTGTGTALDIDSSAVIDWLGRTRKEIDAGGMIAYTVYKDDETRVYPAWNTSTYVTLLPIQVTKLDKDGQVEDDLQLKTSVTPSKDGSNEPTGTESYANSDLVSRTVTTYSDSGTVTNVNRYHSFPESGDGTRYTNYYQTETRYDSMGRVEFTLDDVADESTYDREQVTRNYYDYVGRQIKTAEAVSSNSHDASGDLTVWGDPKTTVEYFFDDADADATPEQGDGDGNLRWTRQWFGTGGSDYNDTEHRYDWRNRSCLTIPPLGPYSLVKYDHLDRVTTSATYSATTNLDPGDDPATTEYANRLTLSKTYFDEWGRAYKTESYDDPADSTPEDELASQTYYDRRKLVWASDPANTGISFTKYDGAGRQIQTLEGTQFDAAKFTSSAPDYPDDDEGIIQLTDYTLDDVGNTTKTVTKELHHTDADGIDLTNNDDYIRSSVYSYYDAAHRLTDTVNFGCNNSDTPRRWKDNSTLPTYDNDGGTAGDQPPSRSDDALVTTYTYNSDGRQEKVTDPKGVEAKSIYDALGQVVAKIEDDAGGATKRKTEYEFNAQGSLRRIMHDPSVDNTFANGVWTVAGGDTDQVTEYAYTDAQNARWVKEIKYPTGDGTVGSSATDKIVFTYNVDGTLATRTDQNSTVLTWSYDTLRRKSEEEVTTLGTYTGGAGAVDGAIRSLTWKYDSEGRVQYVTSHTDTTPDTADFTDAANQVKYTFNATDQLTKEEQEEDGKVDGSTLAVEYGYGTDYGSSYYNRRTWREMPDNRKIWNGYTHSDTGTHQDTINDKFNRVAQIARDNSGAIGSLLAEYDHNGLGRMVRRVHDEDTGKYGNDTRLDLYHGTTGQYDGLDRFGRVKDLKHTDFNGSATDFLRRKYGYDRNGNRTYIDDPLYKGDGQAFSYDNLNRLTDADRGMLNSSNQVYSVSQVSEGFNMDLLGNFVASAGGIKINGATATITQAVNATNEITTLDWANPSGGAFVINEPFTTSLNGYWSQNKGTWSIASNKVNVDTLTSSEAVLLADAKLDIVNYEVDVTFPTSSSTNKAGLIFSHDGNNSYWAVVLNRSTGKIAVYHVVSGSWGSALASANATINDNTSYTIQINRKQGRIEVFKVGQFSFVYDPSTDFGIGQAGLFSDKTGVTFDNFKVSLGYVSDPKTPRTKGSAKASLYSSTLKLESGAGTANAQFGYAAVEGFSDDFFMVQVDMPDSSGEVWVRCIDPNNGYVVRVTGPVGLWEVVDGKYTLLAESAAYETPPTAYKIKIYNDSGSHRFKVWAGGSLVINVTDSTFLWGGVGFSGDNITFDNAKIGYDNNGDDDIDDVGDDIVWNEGFSSSTKTPAYDHAGNLVDDGTFRYVYDAWNRLVAVKSSEDSGAVTFQTAEFDGLGRRIKKVVTNAGEYEKTEVYFYDGQRIVQINNGSGAMVQQFVHGTQYIDELVMMRVKDKGDLYVHQDANWNVIGTTDLGRHVVERSVYTPYGELTVHQDTGFGDRDGDQDVDSTDKGTVGTTCTGTVTGPCRILDLDFDGDYDSTDATKFDSLTQGGQRHPGRPATNVGQPFAHQGLLFEPELAQCQNRARQYDPAKRRFAQRDPAAFAKTTRLDPAVDSEYTDGLNTYNYVRNNPQGVTDYTGMFSCPPGTSIQERIGCRTPPSQANGWSLFNFHGRNTNCRWITPPRNVERPSSMYSCPGGSRPACLRGDFACTRTVYADWFCRQTIVCSDGTRGYQDHYQRDVKQYTIEPYVYPDHLDCESMCPKAKNVNTRLAAPPASGKPEG